MFTASPITLAVKNVTILLPIGCKPGKNQIQKIKKDASPGDNQINLCIRNHFFMI